MTKTPKFMTDKQLEAAKKLLGLHFVSNRAWDAGFRMHSYLGTTLHEELRPLILKANEAGFKPVYFQPGTMLANLQKDEVNIQFNSYGDFLLVEIVVDNNGPGDCY